MRNARPRRFGTLLVALVAWTAVAGPAAADPVTLCTAESDPTTPETSVCTVTRTLSVYYGTLSVAGAGVGPQDFVEFTSLLSDGFRIQLQNDPSVDPRVGAGASSFVDLALTNVEWTLQSPVPVFPAQQNLLDAFALAAGALGPGVLDVGTAVLTYTPTYVGESFVTDGVRWDFQATIALFVQDALFTVRPTAVNEPGTFALLAAGLAALALRRRKAAAVRSGGRRLRR